MAHIIEVPERAMDATHRCDRCGSQAYMEVQIKGAPSVVLLCAHHGTAHFSALMELDATIADHRRLLTPSR